MERRKDEVLNDAGGATPNARSIYAPQSGWPQLPVGLELGVVSGVAVDPDDRVFVLHRRKSPVLCFDRQGKFLFAWGDEEIKTGHGLGIDDQGFLWVTDLKRHQVLKFSSEGRLLLAIGTRDQAGAGLDQFNQPTDVAVTHSGDFFVSDGYGNSRVMKFAATGEFIHSWGREGRNPGEFDTPHAMALSPDGKLYVSDRGNCRIQVFDLEGNFLSELRGLPAFDGLFCGADGTLFGATGRGNEVLRVAPSGIVLESWGGPRSTQSDLDNFVVPPPGRFNVPHGLSVDRHGESLCCGDSLAKDPEAGEAGHGAITIGGEVMRHLRLVSEGILYRNPNPGFRAECAYLPNVLPLSATELICVLRIGSAFYSIDGKLVILRSTDRGDTWARTGLISSQDDRMPYNYTAPHATRLTDGTIVVIARRWDSSDPDLPIFNPATGGMRPAESVLFRSADGGITWSSPEILDLPGNGLADTPSQIIELKDGRWFLACELWKGWDDSSPLHIRGFAVFSEDRGKTWKERIDFPSAADSHKMYSHSRYTRMLDGRIAVLQWTQEIGTASDLDLHFTISDETGRKWSTPHPTGINAQTSWLADLGGGILVATYTRRGLAEPGICVVMSEDGGETWDLKNQVLVWDAVGQEFLGVSHKPSYPASHDNIAFGKPHTARLPNGEIMSSWWCTQACLTHSRFAKLVVEGS